MGVSYHLIYQKVDQAIEANMQGKPVDTN